MAKEIEVIHTQESDPSINLPYAPAIKVTGGSLLFLAGVTAAKTYHHKTLIHAPAPIYVDGLSGYVVGVV